MYRCMLKSKIHRAVLTDADLNYVGSITIDSDLLEAADILPLKRYRWSTTTMEHGSKPMPLKEKRVPAVSA